MYYHENIDHVNIIDRINSFIGGIPIEEPLPNRGLDTESTLIDLVLDHYTDCLLNSELALSYLASRGIDDVEVIRKFRLGYSDRSLGLRLQELDITQEERARGQLKLTGLLKPSGHEFFHGSIVIPYIDENGIVQGGYGRRITPKLKSPSVYHVHWNPANTVFFNQEALQAHEVIIVCKTALEALSYWILGFRNVVSTLGLRHFNEHHLFALQQYGVKKILIAFDNDRKGNRAARQIAQLVSAYDIECCRIRYPQEKDANDCLLFCRQSKPYFEGLVNKAKPCTQSFSSLQKDALNGE